MELEFGFIVIGLGEIFMYIVEVDSGVCNEEGEFYDVEDLCIL